MGGEGGEMMMMKKEKHGRWETKGQRERDVCVRERDERERER